jgi:RND family efflux transporter MFP subunit
MMFMGGIFRAGRIDPDHKPPDLQESSYKPAKICRAEKQNITEYYEAVGTVRPKTETRIEAQITGRILEIPVRPGEKLKKGKILVLLDNRESQTRLDQAKLALKSAKARKEKAKEGRHSARAVLNQAESSYKRLKTLFDSDIVTSHELEGAESTYLQAKARVEQAEEALKETDSEVLRVKKTIEQSRITLGYARIRAPEAGEVVKRMAEPGDLAWPGKPLLIIQTRGELRLEAQVREGLIRSVPLGAELEMVVTALKANLKGIVEEIVPSADPMTRSFLVKIGLPNYEGLYPGMFGRLLIPIEEKEVVVVPKDAVVNIGQMEVVTVLEEDRWKKIFVKTGGEIDNDQIEILSGLHGGEQLALKGKDDE